MLTETLTRPMRSDTNLPPPWVLYSWPAVFWQANTCRRLRLRHLGTRVTTGPQVGRRPMGHTVWGRLDGDAEAGLAWDWVEVTQGVVAMADPMAMVTNVRLLDRTGEVIPPIEAALHLNQFVCRLPWQEEVQRALQLS